MLASSAETGEQRLRFPKLARDHAATAASALDFLVLAVVSILVR